MRELDPKAWRARQIAASILYRYFGNISIVLSDNIMFDLLVSYNDGTDLKFGVNVKSSFFVRSQVYETTVELLKNMDYEEPENRIPVLLMCVNEEKESARIGFQLGWRYGRPRIFKNIELRTLNQDNADKIFEIVKSMDNVIRMLLNNNLSVKKSILFSYQHKNRQIEHFELIYLRKFSDNYKMKQVEVVDEKEKLNRLLNETPEEEYPSDLLDDVIYNSICARFPDATTKSKTILFSSDLQDLQLYEGIHISHCFVNVEPNLSQIPKECWNMINGVNIIRIPVEIFVPGISDLDMLDNVIFTYTFDFDGWLGKYNELMKLKDTMCSITKYFVNNG